jgi:hypothetical protein
MPDDKPAPGDSQATSSAEAAGWGWSLRYTWVHPDDGTQAGALLVSAPDDTGAVTAAWTDSWHQKPGLLVLAGTADAESFDVSAEYAPGWRWRISAEGGKDDLRLEMHNTVPPRDGEPGREYVVMRACWTEADGMPQDFA